MTLTTHVLCWIAKALSGSTIRWVNCQPDTAQRIYFANHTSHLDAIVLWSSLPKEVRAVTRPVAAKDYWTQGIVRRFIAKQFNTLLIERDKVRKSDNPIPKMIQAIGDRESLIIFPEGGRSTGEEVGEFKSGLFHLAKKRRDIEFVPVYIENLNRVLPRGEFLPVPLLSSITIGAPMRLEENETKTQFLSRARDAVCSLKEL
ncbi:MAG: 1-acyl-sn-glycerol-3-phosphate acyltransferase [Planctomycetaceae bacterium]|nr:1-acyl-sn-glycerol-3-phosphate acyltransferase [Planctomycetaceae bacterium]